jgi:hypothetical protein
MMLYTADLAGHRQLYCDVLAGIFLELGYEVLIVAGLSGGGPSRRWRHIERYQGHPNVTLVDSMKISLRGDASLSVEEIVRVQKDRGVAASLFICGDEMRPHFAAIAEGRAPRLQGWNVAEFNWTERWAGMESVFAPGMSLRNRLGRVRDRLGPLNPHWRFFEHVLRKKRVVDAVLVPDERVASEKGYPFIRTPGIYQPFTPFENEETEAEAASVIPAYERFLAEQRGRYVLLYFGAAALYKGYDILLRLALADPTTCFVHCGDSGNDYANDAHVAGMRRELLHQGRLFETGRRLEGRRSINAFFASIKAFVSSHRIYISSATVLQHNFQSVLGLKTS